MALVPAFLGLRRPGDRLPKPAQPGAQGPVAPTAASATPAPRKAEDLPPLKSARQMVKEYLAEPDWPPAGFTQVPGKPGEYRYGPNADGALLVDTAANSKAMALAAGRTRDPELCDIHRRLSDAYRLWSVCRARACQRAKACSRSTTIACVYEQRKTLEPHLPELRRRLDASAKARGDG